MEIIKKFSEQVQKILGTNLTKVILYGSYARGDYTENSDIDIMLLTKLSNTEIDKIDNNIYGLAYDYFIDYGIDISVIIKNEDNYKYWLGALPFYDNIQKEGITIYEQ